MLLMQALQGPTQQQNQGARRQLQVAQPRNVTGPTKARRPGKAESSFAALAVQDGRKLLVTYTYAAECLASWL
jgi:hypothetical protein